MGRLNFNSSMCPFLNIFKFNLNASLAKALNEASATLNEDAKKDLTV
jgi:hypothetical protein